MLNTFYSNLPSPIYYTITFFVPIVIVIYFLKYRHKYNRPSIIGVLFTCLTGFSAGLIRLMNEYQLFNKFSQWLGTIPIAFILIAIPFILVGGYQNSKGNTVKQKKVILIGLGLLIIILYTVLLVIFKLS